MKLVLKADHLIEPWSSKMAESHRSPPKTNST